VTAPAAARAGARKVVLAVVDAMKPEALQRAVAEGRAPTLGALMEHGRDVPDCVSTFPSLTPVAAATITTGAGPDGHHIPSTNWYHRGEERYVEYGSSFQASRAFGFVRQLYDTVYNLNMAHLSRDRRTVFEHLDDAGLRTASTTYLIYRGRTRHRFADEGIFPRIARAIQFDHAVWGPRELFYADLFSSRPTGCPPTRLATPGLRDRHAGCVGAHLVEHELFDFLLLSLPDNDSWSHRRGPWAQVESLPAVDRELARVVAAGGGLDAFLDRHALVVMSDHSQGLVDDRIALDAALEEWRVLRPADPQPERARVAVSPVGRFGAVYVLDREEREGAAPRLAGLLGAVDGVDLAVRLEGEEAVVLGRAGELRFAPGGELQDRRGRSWGVEGPLDVLGLVVRDGRVTSRRYPDALGRLWSALACPTSGDVLLSAEPGYEFVDWGGADQVGGGSHGSLHREDSLGALLIAGLDTGAEPGVWAVGDVLPLVLRHFGLRSTG
jgi:hypothetical protein